LIIKSPTVSRAHTAIKNLPIAARKNTNLTPKKAGWMAANTGQDKNKNSTPKNQSRSVLKNTTKQNPSIHKQSHKDSH
jgi:hypothetical protein